MSLLTNTGGLRRAWTTATLSALVLLICGAVVGVVGGLAVVHVLSLLGLHVDTGTGAILRRILSLRGL